jgi:uncharacterized protein YnzC (UPF0291/DUF896 family)
MVLYEVKNAFLFYDRQYDMITFKWFGSVSDTEYRKALEIAYAKTIELDVTRWLTDSSTGVVISSDSQKWMINEFIPNYISKTPLRRVACLVNEDAMRKEYIDAIRSSFKNYQVEIFDDAQVAREWLTKMYSKKEIVEDEVKRKAKQEED